MNEERLVAQVNNTMVVCTDEPGAGNACHEYRIDSIEKPAKLLGTVSFQNGPIQENGINGVQNEDLLAIVIDRLKGFQSGKFACPENETALIACQEALAILEKRTADRIARNVEGKSIV